MDQARERSQTVGEKTFERTATVYRVLQDLATVLFQLMIPAFAGNLSGFWVGVGVWVCFF